jgi:Do/DeqQ family serine protease
MSGKRIFGILMIALAGSIIGVLVFSIFVKPEVKVVQSSSPTPVHFTGIPSGSFETEDFRLAAEQTVHAVVHVTSKKFLEQNQYRNMWEYFFNEPSGTKRVPKTGYGSGVFISPDGHIVTNNHVIEGYEEYQVKLNDGRVLDAKLVGSDPNTDVAVLQVKQRDIPYLTFGNSDNLHLGDWVLAVGNPFNLYSTVTAGIVSAKGRDMNLIGSNARDPFGRLDRERMANAVESFIQTDAAVNPGNSGGALVNLKGELVGINTAIASRTGYYSGYSFAIPAVIAKKVVEDIIEYGSVQRAVLGITIQTVTADLAEKEKLDVSQGVYVDDMNEDGGANNAGMKIGDVIVAINGKEVTSSPELQEQISRYRPGDVVDVRVDRFGDRKVFEVELGAIDPGARRVGEAEFWAIIGADLEQLDEKELERYDLRNGVRVKKLHDGQFKASGMPEGFIITRINRANVSDVQDVKDYIQQIDGGVFIEGVLPNGRYEFFTYKK